MAKTNGDKAVDPLYEVAQRYKEAETEVFAFTKGKSLAFVANNWTLEIVPKLVKAEKLGYAVLDEDFVWSVDNFMDKRIWTVGVYQYIEMGRKMVKKDPSQKEGIAKVMGAILDRGLKTLEALLAWTEKRYPVTWKNDGTATFKARHRDPNTSECALTFYARILICIGDVHRYSFVTDRDPPLRLAMQYYEKSRKLEPAKPRSFHQMGIVMSERRDRLSASYNFTRANIAPNPPPEAVEVLLDLYDRAYKDHKAVQATFWYAKGNKLETHDREGVRKQVWLFSRGPNIPEPSLPEDPHTKDVHFKNMSPKEIYDRFALTYMNYIGKLFTHIGLESLDEAAEEALVYFEKQLNMKSACLPPLRLLQVLTLNMNMIYRLSPDIPVIKQINPAQQKKFKPDFQLLSALQFAFEMFGVMVERLARLVELCDWDSPHMETCCIGVQVWCSWMKMNVDLWKGSRPRPKFCVSRLHLRIWQNKKEPEDDVWMSFARLITNLERVLLNFSETLFPSISATPDNEHTVCLTPLPESVELAGFPIFSESDLFNQEYYTTKSLLKGRADNYIRMKYIHEFGSEFLFKQNFKLLSRHLNSMQTYSYTSLVKVTDTYKEAELCGLTENHYHYWIHSYNFCPPLVKEFQGERKPDCNNCRVIARKKKRKNPYIFAVPKRPRMPNYEVWLYFSDRRYRTEILVEPFRLVIDTNCFIRKLHYVKILLSLVVKPLYIPVAVILELRGLCKGGLNRRDRKIYRSVYNPDAKDRIKENERTAEKCMEALDFIAAQRKYFYIVTSTGNILKDVSSNDYLADDMRDQSVTNDDRILDACKYLETSDYVARQKDCPRRIYRKTLLISGDRNLRIKCFTLDIPSRPLSSVVFWFYSHCNPSYHASVLESERRWKLKHGINPNSKYKGRYLKQRKNPVPWHLR